jgi:hypothetical protein
MAKDIKEEIHEPGEEAATTTNAEVVTEVLDPLTSEPIIERDHTNISGSSQQAASTPMEEYTPRIAPDEEKMEGMPSEEEPTYDQMNEQMKNMPPEAQEEAAGYAADMVLGLYGEGKRMLGNEMLLFKSKRLNKMHSEGVIDLDMPIPYASDVKDTPTFIPARHAIYSYNEIARDAFGLRPKFVENVRPILVNEFKKRGVGITPMMYLGLQVAGDLRKDFVKFQQLSNANTAIMEAMKEATRYYREHGRMQSQGATIVTPPPPSAPVNETQPAPPTPSPASTAETVPTDIQDIPPPPPMPEKPKDEFEKQQEKNRKHHLRKQKAKAGKKKTYPKKKKVQPAEIEEI